MRKTLLKTFIVTLVVIACLGALELFSRIIHRGTAPLLPYYFEGGAALLPGGCDIRASFYGNPANRYTTDAWGARIADPAYAAERPRDGVFVVGDSQMLGYMLEFDQTFASRLAGPLAAGPGTVRILAAPASHPESYRTALHKYTRPGLARQRLLVVGLNMGNDLDEVYDEGIAPPPDHGTWRRRLLTNSYIYMDLTLLRSHRLQTGDAPVGVNPVSYMLDAQERVILARETMRALEELLNDPAVEADHKLLVIIPADIQLDPGQFRKYRRYYKTEAEFQKWNAQSFALSAMMNALEEYVASQMEQRGHSVVRFSKIVPQGEEASHMFDDESHHLTGEAHALLADAILAAVGGRN